MPSLASMSALLDTSELTVNNLLGAVATLGILHVIVWPFAIAAPIFGTWLALEKARQPGWIALVPVYNWIQLLRVAGLPGWWLALLLVPGPNVVVWGICCMRFAGAFGKGRAFGAGLLLFPPLYMAMLGIGASTYRGSIPPWGAQRLSCEPLPA